MKSKRGRIKEVKEAIRAAQDAVQAVIDDPELSRLVCDRDKNGYTEAIGPHLEIFHQRAELAAKRLCYVYDRLPKRGRN